MDFKTYNFQGNIVRYKDIEGILWFVALDLVAITGHKKIRTSIYSILDKNQYVTMGITDKLGRIVEQIIIEESGFYLLMFRSNKTEAKIFTRIVASEILPQIRKTGSFGNSQLQENVNQLRIHKEYLKTLKIQTSELNKKIRYEKMKIDELEYLLFISKLESNPKAISPTVLVQTDLFNNNNNILE